MKLTKSQLLKIIKEELSEVGGLGRAMGDDNPDYELIDSMLGRVEGTDSLLNAEGFRDVDPALKQQAIDAAAALHTALLQIRESIPRRTGMDPGGAEGSPVTLRDPKRLGQQLAFEDKE